MLISIKEIVYLLIHGEKTHGYEYWEGKPKFYIGFMFYDSWHFVFHLGKFWYEADC